MKTIPPSSIRPGDPGTVLLDVRTPAEFSGIHVRDSVLMPLHALDPSKVRGLMAGKSACYLLCHSGARAVRAGEKLRAAGLDNLFVVEGGIQAWASAGLPVDRGRATVSLERQVRMAAGTLVVTGVVLGSLVAPAWFVLSALVGGGLLFSGITDTCAMGLLLARMPWNNRPPAA